ncbi:triple tyrosine motif-containing protein [Mesonia aestuariivivens]|uniref:HTH luxR-type domain-containing protein n=1 Tax=Mesonia aestuariivivens TaxID=2796128 RepID=A0ABS6W329_9FLAO|nr:triple tyrosine motif-containing protein [Mesonia aestuariivivens]MBW2962268.1 hypothetical protein [Mesonia aestuariivivens]
MRYFCIIFIFLLTYSVFSQELPPILNFSTKSYQAGNQNWMIAQDKEKKIYIANSAGLLSYDGERWILNKTPNGSFIRSVAVVADFIFTGSYMDFGFWEEEDNGELTYKSLSFLLDKPFIDGEQIWHIEAVKDYVIFQSLNRLYSYNIKTNKVVIIPTTNTVVNLFKEGNKIYYQVENEGLYVIYNGKTSNYIPNSELNNQILVGLYNYKNSLYLITRNNKLFKVKGKKLVDFKLDNFNLFSDASIFLAKLVNNQYLVLGTIGNGLRIYDLENKSVTNFKQPSILNNTILSLYYDINGNLWSGLDNGISLINLNNSVKIFNDTYGDIGTVYCSYQNNDDVLYLGTNQGLYAKKINSKANFRLIPKTSGQVWSIQKVSGRLLVGHDKGTFLIQDFFAKNIYNKSGTWQVKPYKNGILQGHYNGMSYAKIEGDRIQSFHRFAGYDLSSRNIVVDSLLNEIWVGHDHKGVYRLKVDVRSHQIEVLDNYQLPAQEDTGSSIFRFYDKIYIATAKLIYKYDDQENSFEEALKLNQLFNNHQRSTGVSKVIDNNKLWSFGKKNIYQISKNALQNDYVLNAIPIPNNSREIGVGFENIASIGENRFLLGANSGYLTFEIPFEKQKISSIIITSFKAATKGEEYTSMSLSEKLIEIPYKSNSINFSFAIPHYHLLTDVEYSYQLEGYDEHWTAWSNEGEARFRNLPYGDYVFRVKGNLNGQETEIENFQFSIKKPWYLSNLLLIFYFVSFLLIVYTTNRLYNNYYKKEQEKIIAENKKQLKLQEITAQQEIITLKNQKLEAEVISKNRELAVSTMNIIRKNEFLLDLKQKLMKISSDVDIEEVITIINSKIAEKDNWKLFKEAFDNADKDFLQSVKSKHPNLTSNDLKLCAYLRLNLSSKEIAPMLNISVRSVEIKRYRLRKKIELPHEQGLVEYILTF